MPSRYRVKEKLRKLNLRSQDLIESITLKYEES